jgi:hypothetical protein
MGASGGSNAWSLEILTCPALAASGRGQARVQPECLSPTSQAFCLPDVDQNSTPAAGRPAPALLTQLAWKRKRAAFLSPPRYQDRGPFYCKTRRNKWI